MSRARWVRPEQLSTPKFEGLTIEARYLFLCLPVFCDDFGTHLLNSRLILSEVFSYDVDRNAAWVMQLVNELADQGLVLKLDYAQTQWLYFVHWEDEQAPGMRHRAKTVNIPPELLQQLVAAAVADRCQGDFFQTDIAVAPVLLPKREMSTDEIMAEAKRRVGA